MEIGRLSGKFGIVTGAASGVGKATAELFAQHGARLLLVDIQKEALIRVAAELPDGAATIAVADVSSEIDTQRYVSAAVNEFGGLDFTVLNAAIFGDLNNIVDYSVEAFDRILAINVRGPWLGLKYMIPHFQKRGGGSIVMTSSINGFRGSPLLSGYVASKHAMDGLMRTAAIECAPHNIRVNSVNPGPIDTPMGKEMEDLADSKFGRNWRNDLTPTPLGGRDIDPEEVAAAIMFLASDESCRITGQQLVIDGGLTERSATWQNMTPLK